MGATVSVIVPIYNAEQYLNECIESIVNQTYRDIEILLVVQKGQDSSLEMSQSWAKKDSRVRLIIKEEKDKGLGSARNTGVKEANGEYVCWVDADDTIAATYVEKLYTAARKANADVAECDYYRVQVKTKEKEYAHCVDCMGREFGLYEKILIGRVSVWKLLVKKMLIIENAIWQPNTVSQDVSVYLKILLCAKKVVNVTEALYFYNRYSSNSMAFSKYEERFNTVKTMACNLKKEYIDSENEVKRYIHRTISTIGFNMLVSLKDCDCVEYMNRYCAMCTEVFGEHLSKEVILGSFNLAKIVNKLDFIENPYSRVCFSSMISIMSEKKGTFPLSHKNRYREIMLERDRDKFFWKMMSEEKPQYFLFDLIEERHNIVEIGASYYTQSDAWLGMESIPAADSIIERADEKCTELWKTACNQFMNRMKEYECSIIMVENYLCETYGDGTITKEYPHVEKIRKMNHILRQYYNHIKNNFPYVITIDAYGVPNYCTDEHYEYGCYPWHINEWANMDIAAKIQERVHIGE